MYKRINLNQFTFIMSESEEYLKSIPEELKEKARAGMLSDGETKDIFTKQFEHICKKMLESDDKEIKIELSRHLMYKGFQMFNSEMCDAVEKSKDLIEALKQ